MSTPSRGTGNSRDPIALDSSDEDRPRSSQAGPSSAGARPGRSSSTRPASLPQSSQFVDLTLEDSGSGSDTVPPPSSSKPPSSSSRSTRQPRRSIPSNTYKDAIDLSDDQPMAGPSRQVKEEVMGEVGSWLNPAVYDPNAAKSRIQPEQAPSGSWLNPATYVPPPSSRSISPNTTIIQDGNWLNPTVLAPPRADSPPKEDFVLPQSWTDLRSLSSTPGPNILAAFAPHRTVSPPKQDFALPQVWTNLSSLPSANGLNTPAEPSQDISIAGPSTRSTNIPKTDAADHVESWIDPLNAARSNSVGSQSAPEPNVEPSTSIHEADDGVAGSWLSPVTLEPPQPIQPVPESESGSWLNPATLQPNISYKRSPSPTELVREEAKSRKGKARKIDPPPTVVEPQKEETIVKPLKVIKKGPKWATDETPSPKKSQAEDVSKQSGRGKTTSPSPVPMAQRSTSQNTVEQDVIMQYTALPTPLPVPPVFSENDMQIEEDSQQDQNTVSDPQTLPPNSTPVSQIFSEPVLESHLDLTSPPLVPPKGLRDPSPAPTANPSVPISEKTAQTASAAVQPISVETTTETSTISGGGGVMSEVAADVQIRGQSSTGEVLESETFPLLDQAVTGISRSQIEDSTQTTPQVSAVPQHLSPMTPMSPSSGENSTFEQGSPQISTEVPIPQTPEISIPQTPRTTDSQEVDAVLGTFMISPIAEIRPATATQNNQIDILDSQASPAEDVGPALEEPLVQPEQCAEPDAITNSPTIHPLPSASYNPSPEPSIRDDQKGPQPLASTAVPVSPSKDSDVKPVLPLPSDPISIPSIHGSSSMHPIEIDDDDLDCLTSDKGDESPIRQELSVEKAVEEVRIGMDDVEIAPLPQDSLLESEQRTRRSSTVPSIEEITGDAFIPKSGEPSRSARHSLVSGNEPCEEPDESHPIPRVRPRSNRKIISSPEDATRVSASSPISDYSPPPKFEVVIPTRSRQAWRWIVEHEGESDVEDLVDETSDGAPSSGPSNAAELVEYNGFTVRSSYKIPIAGEVHTPPEDIESNIHTVLSEVLPDPLPPSDRIGRANRILNTKLIDEWNRRKPHLTNNPSLHRAVFEAYMAQSTSIDEPQADEIRVINDIDGEGAPPDFEFQYSNDMLYNPDVPDPELGIGCDCDGPCDPNNKNCSCVRRQELYFYDLGMKGFAYDDLGRIKETSVSVWECGKKCGCPPECGNRIIQRGRGKDTKIELFKTRWKGWGVRARAPIAAGTFLGIYAGELITEQESEERGKLYAQIGRTYLFDCDGWQIAHPPSGLSRLDSRSAELAELASQRAKIAAEEADDPSYVYSAYSVDAFHYGFTRYFNHSCDPNLAITQAYVKDFHPERPILVIFARRPIARNEELCISYKGLPDDDEIPIPTPQPKLTTRNAKAKKSKTSASAHITPTTKGKVAAKDKCMCKTARCDGRMFNYGG
ncbi:hypothetical protein V865_003723 [Kwoniella europaea PYCC6329]|uniref:SET domain-containing protein n=1 Tax=Kwoniella europaea PYCC6329 TaxID=1423913 RepID=A0AAX4KGK7_9TREE